MFYMFQYPPLAFGQWTYAHAIFTSLISTYVATDGKIQPFIISMLTFCFAKKNGKKYDIEQDISTSLYAKSRLQYEKKEKRWR